MKGSYCHTSFPSSPVTYTLCWLFIQLRDWTVSLPCSFGPAERIFGFADWGHFGKFWGLPRGSDSVGWSLNQVGHTLSQFLTLYDSSQFVRLSSGDSWVEDLEQSLAPDDFPFWHRIRNGLISGESRRRHDPSWEPPHSCNGSEWYPRSYALSPLLAHYLRWCADAPAWSDSSC